jgi:hypothetical protein
MFQTEIVEKIKTRIFKFNYFFGNRAIYEIMWKIIVEPDRSQMTIRRMRIESWILKTTNSHTEYVIHIAFLMQQSLHEGAQTLRDTYNTSHV